ncbi:B alpha pheromone receptor, partial [Mycena galopus ATCC 62051]
TLPLFSIFALLGFILSLVPLYCQLEAWNVGTIWYIFWVVMSCFTQYFNSVVWADNTAVSAPAWCEISIRIGMAVSVGLPAASLCINRRLYAIARMPPAAVVNKPMTRRAIIEDSFISGLFPTLYIALQLVVQRHRFSILEDVGCIADLYDSIPTYFMSFTAPLMLSVGSVVYGALLIVAVSASRANLEEKLTMHKTLTTSRFLRLNALALTTLVLTFPLGILRMATNASLGALATEVSGDTAPFDFGLVARIPRVLWAARDSTHVAIELTRWVAPVCALVFFAYFGLAGEAREQYMRCFTVVSNAV